VFLGPVRQFLCYALGFWQRRFQNLFRLNHIELGHQILKTHSQHVKLGLHKL